MLGITDYKNQTHSKHLRWKKCLSLTLIKNEKIFIKCGAHLQCVNNH